MGEERNRGGKALTYSIKNEGKVKWGKKRKANVIKWCEHTCGGTHTTSFFQCNRIVVVFNVKDISYLTHCHNEK